ncbi:uncharacterized protein LOC136040969 isoform X2 [Artemia franciscana]|uniref:uncharacterized protein LOC136040969 isoform X2 n=1 Tax=Artemia franciscana TaxID=6661 RepID=UPI0032D9E73F
MILDADLTFRMFFQIFLSVIFQLAEAQSGYEFVSQNSNSELPFQTGVSTGAVNGTVGFQATSSGSGMRLEDSIPGIPAVDYPIFPFVPPTQFTCDGKLPGYYADTETGCQAFHICYDDRMASFLCPNGTTFHQQFFVCDWWFNSDCNQAPSFYSVNANLFVTHHSSQTGPLGTGSTLTAQTLSNYATASQTQTGQSVFSNQGSYSQARQSVDQQEEQETPKDLRQYFNSGYYSLQPSQKTVANDLKNQVQGVSTETNIGNIQQQSGLIQNQQPFIQPSQQTQTLNLESLQQYDLSQNNQQSIEPLQYTQFFQGTQSVNSQQLPQKLGMTQDQQQFIQSSQSPQFVKTSQVTQSANLQQLTQQYQKAGSPSVTSSFQQIQQPQSLISQRLQPQGTIKQSLQFVQSETNKNLAPSQNSQSFNTQQPIVSQKLLNSVGTQQDILKQAGQRQQVGNTISAQNGQAYSYKSSEPNQLYQNTFFNSGQFPGVQRTGLESTKTTGMRYKKAPMQDYQLNNFQEENSIPTIQNVDNNTEGTKTNFRDILTSTGNPTTDTIPENSIGEAEQSINRLGDELPVLEVGEAFIAQREPQIITELNFQDVTTVPSNIPAILMTRSPTASAKTITPLTLDNQPKQQIINNSQNIFKPSQQIFAKTITAKTVLLASTEPLMQSQLAKNSFKVQQKYSQALPNQQLSVKQQQIPDQGNTNQQNIHKTSFLQHENHRNVVNQLQSVTQKPLQSMINKQNMREQSVINTPLSVSRFSNDETQQQVVKQNGAQTTTSSLKNLQNLTGAEILVTQPATYARAQQLPVSLKQAVYNQATNQQYIQGSGNLNTNQISHQKIQTQGQQKFIQATPSKLSTPYYTPQSPLFGKRIVPLKARNNSEQPMATRRTLQSLGGTVKHWPSHIVSRSTVRDSIPGSGSLLITKIGPTPTFHTYWQRYSTYP